MRLTRRGASGPPQQSLIACWATTLAVSYGIAGRDGLGTLLAAGFAVQVAPSLWTAYRTAQPTGTSAGTWTLILGELACFLVYGLHKADPRLTALGITGVISSLLMLARIYWARRPLGATGDCVTFAASRLPRVFRGSTRPGLCDSMAPNRSDRG